MSTLLRARARVREHEMSTLVLESAPMAGCARCARGQGCGGGVFTQLLRFGQHDLRVPYAGPTLPKGQLVWLEVEDQVINRMALWAWGLPLLALLFAALAWANLSAWPAGLISGLLGLGLGCLQLGRGRRPGQTPLRVVPHTGDDDAMDPLPCA